MPVFMDVKEFPVPEHQPDAYLSQANPVSSKKYTVLPTTKNVRILSISSMITWATTQPTPLQVYVTIDGQILTFNMIDPVSDTDYMAVNSANVAGGGLLQTGHSEVNRSFFIEGRSVKVEVKITWATTQPTPLVCRVKYAKW